MCSLFDTLQAFVQVEYMSGYRESFGHITVKIAVEIGLSECLDSIDLVRFKVFIGQYRYEQAKAHGGKRVRIDFVVVDFGFL
jgi:hypothetical protein